MAKASDFRKGEKVFNDTFQGLIPAVVVGHLTAEEYRAQFFAKYDPERYLKIRYTATRGAYKKGQIDVVTAHHVAKRAWIHHRGGSVYIREPARPYSPEDEFGPGGAFPRPGKE